MGKSILSIICLMVFALLSTTSGMRIELMQLIKIL